MKRPRTFFDTATNTWRYEDFLTSAPTAERYEPPPCARWTGANHGQNDFRIATNACIVGAVLLLGGLASDVGTPGFRAFVYVIFGAVVISLLIVSRRQRPAIDDLDLLEGDPSDRQLLCRVSFERPFQSDYGIAITEAWHDIGVIAVEVDHLLFVSRGLSFLIGGQDVRKASRWSVGKLEARIALRAPDETLIVKPLLYPASTHSPGVDESLIKAFTSNIADFVVARRPTDQPRTLPPRGGPR